MNISYLKAWLAAGFDQAVLSFVYGLLRWMAAAGLVYTSNYIHNFHFTTAEALLVVAIIDRLIKSSYIYLKTGPNTGTLPDPTPVDPSLQAAG